MQAHLQAQMGRTVQIRDLNCHLKTVRRLLTSRANSSPANYQQMPLHIFNSAKRAHVVDYRYDMHVDIIANPRGARCDHANAMTTRRPCKRPRQVRPFFRSHVAASSRPFTLVQHLEAVIDLRDARRPILVVLQHLVVAVLDQSLKVVHVGGLGEILRLTAAGTAQARHQFAGVLVQFTGRVQVAIELRDTMSVPRGITACMETEIVWEKRTGCE